MWIKRLILHAYILARLPFLGLLALTGPLLAKKAAGIMRVLVVRLDRLGDFVATLPVIDSIKARYPDAEVSVLVRPYLAGLAKEVRSIDRVVAYEGLGATARILRQSGFALAIDPLDDYRIWPAVMAFLSGAPRRAGFSGGFRELLFTDVVRSRGTRRPMAEINLDVVRALGIPVAGSQPRVALRGIGGPSKAATVALHPGGHYRSQRWPADRFAELGRMIADAYDVEILVIGGPDDRSAVDTILARVGSARSRALLPDMKTLAEELARSALLICNNSGPLHLAAALGVATVSTMGPTDPARWRPRSDTAIVLRKDLACSPCGRGVCAGHACMDAISVQEMFEAVKKILDGNDAIAKRR